MEEIIKELKDLKLQQKSGEFTDDLPSEIHGKYFANKPVAEGLDVDKHRWYETTITVYKVAEGFIGVRSCTDLFSESMGYDDVQWEPWFGEMVEVNIPTYIVKK